MQPARILCTICCLYALTAVAQNEPPKTKPISLEEAIQMALQNNFDVKIQRFNPQIARYNLSGSYGAYEPQVGLSAVHSFRSQPGGIDQFGRELGTREVENDSFTGNITPGISGLFPTGLKYRLNTSLNHNKVGGFGAQTETHTGDWNLQLDQPLLRDFWIDAGRAQILINKKALKISELGLMHQLMVTISNVEQAYYNLIFAGESVKVQEKARELFERLLMETRKKVEVGSLAVLDEKQAESQVATSKADLLATRRNLAVQENVLKSLITADFAVWEDTTLIPAEKLVAVPVPLNLQESWRKGLTQRPDLQQSKMDLETRDITLRYQKNQIFPALDLVGSYGHNGLDTSYSGVFGELTRNDNPSYTYGATLSIPLGNLGPRNRYKASKAEKQKALLQLKKLEQDIMVQIDDAVKLVQTDLERVEATRQAQAFAEAALDAEQKKLENGKSTPFLVLQATRDLTSARFEAIRALSEFNNALAQLAFREGATLERHRLNVTIK